MIVFQLLAMSLVGGILLLDRWAVGEFGLSQPVVSCSLLGLLFGDFSTGLFVGVCLQLVWAGSLPLGSEVPPDAQSAGVVAGSCVMLARRFAPDFVAQAIFLAFALAAVASIIGGHADVGNRKLNRFLYVRGLTARRTGLLVGYQALGLLFTLIRGFVVTAIFGTVFVILMPILRFLPALTRTQLLAIPLSIGLGSAAVLFVTRRRIPLVALGSAVMGAIWIWAR